MARRVTLVLALAGLLAVPAAVLARVGGSATCPNANVVPSADNANAVRAAVRCLVNRERAREGVRPLGSHEKLRRAANRHSADMVARRYFSHISPHGADTLDRVVAARYASPHGVRALGEDLRWGVGSDATAASAVRAWMASPPHRKILLASRFRELGAGVALGAPVDLAGGQRAATYTAVFTTRD
jgi:uncharacterized protein YkwD